MASKKKKIYHLLSYLVILVYLQRIQGMNIDCGGKAFHCVNSTHFMICVDFGAGISKTVDEFIIQCPSTAVCGSNNRFECEYQLPTTTELTTPLGEETNEFEINQSITTISPSQETNVLLSKYLNTVYFYTQTDFVTHKQTPKPGLAVEITDFSTNTMNILSRKGTKLKTSFLNNSVADQLKDKKLLQEHTTLPYSEKSIQVESKGVERKTSDLINGSSTSHVPNINDGVETLNKTDIYVKLLDSVLYKKTESNGLATSTLSSRDSNNINIVNATISNLPDDSTLLTSTESLKNVNIFEKSTITTTNILSSSISEKLLTSEIPTIETPLSEDVYRTMEGISHFEDSFSSTKYLNKQDELLSETKTEKMVTERTLVFTTSLENNTIPTYDGNILKEISSTVIPVINNITSFSKDDYQMRHFMTTLKPEVKSTADVKGTIKATKQINDVEVTSAAPYLIITDHVTKKDKMERKKVKIFNTTHFSRNQIPTENVLSEDVSHKISENHTTIELLEEITRSPNYVVNPKDKNYKSLKTIVEINNSVPSYHKLSSDKNTNAISSDLEFTTTIVPLNVSEIELINVARGIKNTSTSVNVNTNTLGHDQVAISMAWINILNVSSPQKSIILAKSNLSTFEPNSVIVNKVADSVSSFKIKEEIAPFSNNINQNTFPEKTGVQLITDTSNRKDNLTRGFDNESYVTESGQITTVPTVHPISISKVTTDTALDTMTFSNITVMHTLQDKLPVEVTTTEINKFSSTKSASKRFESDPIITINFIVDQTNQVNNEQLQSIERTKTINEFISIKDQSITEPVKKDFYYLSTTLSSTSLFADKTFAPTVSTIMAKTTTETNKGKENVSNNQATEQTDSKKLGILCNLVTETILPHVLKTTENIADTNTYRLKNSKQNNANSLTTPSMPKKNDILSSNQLFSNTHDKILWNNFTTKNTSSEGKTAIHTKDYNQESSSQQNGAKITMNDDKIVNLEAISSKTDIYSFLSKYQSSLSNERIHEMLTTDVSIKVDDYNILGSEIYNNNPLSNKNTENVVTINNVIEKPIIISYPQQPKDIKDSIKNIIPNNFRSTSTIKEAHIYSVLSNVVSDESKNKSIQKDKENNQEKLMYGLNETTASYTAGQTNNLLNNMSSTEMYTKSIKTNGVVSTYPTKISVKKNNHTNTDVNQILCLSSSISENITLEKELNHRELHINKTQIDYLLTDVNQNIPKGSAKYDSLKTDVSSISTEKNKMHLLKITPTSNTFKALSTHMPNLYVKISNKLSVTDIPTNSSLIESDKIILHKVKNNSTVKNFNGNNTDVNYEHINNTTHISNQSTVLSNNNTSTFSTEIKVENFKKVTINADSVFDTTYIKKVNMELLNPKLQENIPITTSYTEIPTTSIQPINKGTGSINITKRSDGEIGKAPVPSLTLNGITETKINKNNELHFFKNYSASLSANKQKPELRIDDVKGNYVGYKYSNNENKIRTVLESVIEERPDTPLPALIQNFKYISTVPTKILREKASSGNNTNGYLSKQISAAQSPYTAMGELTNNSLNKEADQNFTNEVQFICRNKFRGRYANNNDCSKFYTCIGKIKPLLGQCPVNTVFSEIKKQCTKNLSHCFIKNQFHCIQDGRFSDVLKNNVYYLCVKNKSNYVRYQFQCQSGYHLNKNSVRCVSDKQIQPQMSSTSLDNDSNKASDQSTVERKSKEIKQTDLITEKNACKYEGKFWDPDDCRRYYVCSKNSKSIFRRRSKKCDSDEVFHREKKKCVNEDSYECK